MRRNMTYDQGREMAMHAKLTQQINIPVYFCDPLAVYHEFLLNRSHSSTMAH